MPVILIDPAKFYRKTNTKTDEQKAGCIIDILSIKSIIQKNNNLC